MVTASSLTKTYLVHETGVGLAHAWSSLFRRQTREVVAVRDVSLIIEPGEIVGMLGPNGAGKTTLLKMLTGLLYPTRGEARVAGFEPAARSLDFLRSISFIMGNRQQLTWDLPVIESLRLNQALYRITERDFSQRLGELVTMLGVDALLARPVRQLSLGERMKCELVCGLLHQPRVLFLDEPTLGLDAPAQQAIRSFIRAYRDRYAATVVLTSHAMADITALATRTVLIDRGEKRYDGPLRLLIERAAPEKVIRLQLTADTSDVQLERFGRIGERGQGYVELYVARGDVPRVANELLTAVTVRDIAIEELPVERVVSALYRGEAA